MLLFVPHLYPGPRLHLLEVTPGEFQIAGKRLNGIIDVALGGVSVPLGDQCFDNTDDPADMVGGLRLHRRPGQAKAIHILIKSLNIPVGDRTVISPLLIGAIDNFVIDVGIVADVGNIVAGIFQVAKDDIERHAGAGMADMAIIINGYPADVHPDRAGGQRNKKLFFTGEGVVNT